MNRRNFLASITLAGVGKPLAAAADRANFVTSDAGNLKRVLVHAPGPETQKRLPDQQPHPEMPNRVPLRPEGIAQHQALIDRLTKSQAEVLFLEPLLNEAIRQCRRARRFRSWVAETFPQLVGREDEITASVLCGAVDSFVFNVDDGGNLNPLTIPLDCLFFTRDIAAMTPRGVVIGNIAKPIRVFETALARLAFRWSPALTKYPIAFDAVKEGVYLQGGDLIVLDENTLLLGIGNVSSEAAARRLARKLEMDVVGVQLPGGRSSRRGEVTDDWDALRTFFLHLDSFFNLVDKRKAITLPYLLEAKYSTSDIFPKVASGFQEVLRKSGRSAKDLQQIGRVRVFKANTGALDPGVSGVKLVDYLSAKGYRFIYPGGEPRRAVDDDLLRTHIVPETLLQGLNVVVLRPGQVVAYQGNTKTLQALERAGITVVPMPSSELALWHGGPHCMTMPLERSPLGE